MTDEFICCLRYDYIFNNQFEELPDYLNKYAEEKYKQLKRYLSNDEEFKELYFNEIKKEVKIINEFRIAEIGIDFVLFIYREKDNIFNRCKTYIINDFIEEKENEQKG